MAQPGVGRKATVDNFVDVFSQMVFLDVFLDTFVLDYFN